MSKVINCYSSLKKSSQKGSLGLKRFNTTLFIVTLIFGAFYLVNVSDLTVKGFALRELKAEVASLNSEARVYEEKVDSLQSYYSLNSRAQELNMVAVSDIEYLALTDTVVAKK